MERESAGMPITQKAKMQMPSGTRLVSYKRLNELPGSEGRVGVGSLSEGGRHQGVLAQGCQVEMRAQCSQVFQLLKKGQKSRKVCEMSRSAF